VVESTRSFADAFEIRWDMKMNCHEHRTRKRYIKYSRLKGDSLVLISRTDAAIKSSVRLLQGRSVGKGGKGNHVVNEYRVVLELGPITENY